MNKEMSIDMSDLYNFKMLMSWIDAYSNESIIDIKNNQNANELNIWADIYGTEE